MSKQPLCLVIALLFLVLPAAPGRAETQPVTPFYTINQSPLVQIFGLPAPENALVQPRGHAWSLLALDMANNYSHDATTRERILIDGESYRVTLALRYGITEKLELGADLPMVGYSGGVLDRVIEGWHSIFGMSQEGRTSAPRDRLLVTYSRDFQEQLHVDHGSFGIGDLRLTSGWQLLGDHGSPARALAVRASLKLPTGNSAQLHGSGSTDFALWLTGSDDHLLPGTWGHLTLFGAGGALALTDGRVLRREQNNLIGYGTLGLGWAPADWFALKTQVAVHSPFYHGSDLNEMGQPAVQLIFGGSVGLSPRTSLDIGASEDVAVTTSPDFALHLGLSHQF